MPRLNPVAARLLGPKEYTDTSWKVFCTSRDVRFRESEYAVPRASLPAVIHELRAWIDGHDVSLPFPVEVRFTENGPDYSVRVFDRRLAPEEWEAGPGLDLSAMARKREVFGYDDPFEGVVLEHQLCGQDHLPGDCPADVPGWDGAGADVEANRG